MINKNFSIRTDLAMEACELLNTEKDIIDGIKSKTKSDNDIEVYVSFHQTAGDQGG